MQVKPQIPRLSEEAHFRTVFTSAPSQNPTANRNISIRKGEMRWARVCTKATIEKKFHRTPSGNST